MKNKYLICNNCDETLSSNDLERKIQLHPYGQGYAEEAYYVCPYCGDDSFEDALACDDCGEIFPEDEMEELDYNYFCKECYERYIAEELKDEESD